MLHGGAFDVLSGGVDHCVVRSSYIAHTDQPVRAEVNMSNATFNDRKLFKKSGSDLLWTQPTGSASVATLMRKVLLTRRVKSTSFHS